LRQQQEGQAVLSRSRLRSQGLTRHDALDAIGMVLTEEILPVRKEAGESDPNTSYLDRLKRLTAAAWWRLAAIPYSFARRSRHNSYSRDQSASRTYRPLPTTTIASSASCTSEKGRTKWLSFATAIPLKAGASATTSRLSPRSPQGRRGREVSGAWRTAP
jgi:hypothetical protein